MDFSMFQGDSKRVHFTLKRADGTPLDITGGDIRWQASKLKAPGVFSSTPVLQKTIGSGVEVLDSFQGLVTVTLSPADTNQISGSFYHELEVSDFDGDIATVYAGEFQVKKALIKPPVTP